jgi:hypothetical protein
MKYLNLIKHTQNLYVEKYTLDEDLNGKKNCMFMKLR